MDDMDKETCFVIMPFSTTTKAHTEKYWNNFFNAIKKEMELQNFICKRSEPGPFQIIRKVIENINKSHIVIAVLTDMNPNVWYELGIRHTLRNGTLMLIENDQQIPFDISSYGLVKYSDDISFTATLEKEIRSYCNKLREQNYFDSPVLDTLKFPPVSQNKLDEIYEFVVNMANENSHYKYNELIKDKKNHNRILWVDDLPSNNKPVIHLFQRKNIRFDIAFNTEQGIELFIDNKYDLIITDMKRGSEPDAGLKLIKQVKQLDTANITPIVVFTSYYSVEKYGSEVMKLGALYLVTGFSNLVSLISQIFEGQIQHASATLE
jgi:CheY-like chemotaxis protein